MNNTSKIETINLYKLSLCGLVGWLFVSLLACSSPKQMGVALYEMDKEISLFISERESKDVLPKKDTLKQTKQDFFPKKDTSNTNKQTIFPKKDTLIKNNFSNAKKVVMDTQRVIIYEKKVLIDTQKIIPLNKNAYLKDNYNNNFLNNTPQITPQRVAYMVDSVLNMREKSKNVSNGLSNNPISNNPNPNPSNNTLPQEKTIINNYYNTPLINSSLNPKEGIKDTLTKKDTLKNSLLVAKKEIKDTLTKKDTLKNSLLVAKKEIKDTLAKKYTLKNSLLVAKKEIKDTLTKKENPIKEKEIIFVEKLVEKKENNLPKIDTFKINAFYGINELQPNNKADILVFLDNIVAKIPPKNILEMHLSGYTDGQGTPAKNKILSQNRVIWLKEQLLQKNIDEKIIFLQYFGQKYASTQSDNPKERRVEVMVIYQKP